MFKQVRFSFKFLFSSPKRAVLTLIPLLAFIILYIPVGFYAQRAVLRFFDTQLSPDTSGTMGFALNLFFYTGRIALILVWQISSIWFISILATFISSPVLLRLVRELHELYDLPRTENSENIWVYQIKFTVLQLGIFLFMLIISIFLPGGIGFIISFFLGLLVLSLTFLDFTFELEGMTLPMRLKEVFVSHPWRYLKLGLMLTFITLPLFNILFLAQAVLLSTLVRHDILPEKGAALTPEDSQ